MNGPENGAERFGGLHLGPRQVELLDAFVAQVYLGRSGMLTTSELARRLGQPGDQVRARANRLVEHGYLTRMQVLHHGTIGFVMSARQAVGLAHGDLRPLNPTTAQPFPLVDRS